MAYHYIPNHIKNIIVIGPSHRYGFDGASVGIYDRYPTPFGELLGNTILSKKLIEEFEFLTFYDEVHTEHSTETQLPFIKYYQGDKKLVEVIYSKCTYEDISKLTTKLLEDKDNFLIISTDLSHFYTLDEANQKDLLCLEGIKSINIELLDQGCEACGMIGIKGILKTSNTLKLQTKLLDYRTSADISQDKKSVVGYTSFVIY